MASTAVNIQTKANELVELANAFEQSAMNQRWDECMAIIGKLPKIQGGIILNCVDIDPMAAEKIAEEMQAVADNCIDTIAEVNGKGRPEVKPTTEVDDEK